MVCDITYRTYNPILISVSTTTKTEFGGSAIDNLFEGELSGAPLLRIFPRPGGYRQTRRREGQRFVRASSVTTIAPSKAELTLDISTAGIDARAMLILLRTAEIAESNGALITLLDYQGVEASDMISQITTGSGRPYTTRTGKITIDSVGAIAGYDIARTFAPNGFSFKFEQFGLVD